ncbi:hypothetical protein DFH28DRAFT_931486 [Melampsora americana]|nr:hypothetical protein DFH28DRAFT_931486 [Melampsora americana]
MTNQKKIKLAKPENLKRKPQNELDARCLAMKRRSRVHAEMTVGQAVSNAAETYDRHEQPIPGGTGEIIMPLDHFTTAGRDDQDEQPYPHGQSHASPPPHDGNLTNVDITGYSFALNLNDGFYAGRRQLEEEQWQTRYPAMFPVFMACQERTNNWSKADTRFKDWKERCNCTGTLRTFDVLDLTFRKQIELKMCSCSPNDQVRLIQAGYIGGTPVRPQQVITIRLLRFFHIVWKYCSLRFLAFSEALNKFLDEGNPLFLTKGNNCREWHRTLSSAIDAYRQMIVMTEEAVTKSLNLTIQDKLAVICPQCYGPGVGPLPAGEPDHIVCLDGNFQHRRHLAASIEKGGIVTPSLFLPPQAMESLQAQFSQTGPTGQGAKQRAKVPWHEAEVDPCAARHTAADDVRGKSHWQGCDETGLMGMACRHDQCLRFISIIQSGEKNIYPLTLLNWLLKATEAREGELHESLGLLYDIGCTLQKSIVKHKHFPEERAKDRLKFGTSLFHSFVHEWACQLDYNPRLNDGWGLSDGEGMERIWSDFESLVRPLRYSTKQHRLTALNFRAMHRNERGRHKSAARSLDHLHKTQKKLSEARGKLRELNRQHGHTEEYLKTQWERKKAIQSQTISQSSAEYLEHVAELVDLEEQLVVAQRRRRNDRHPSGVPNTLVLLEKAIDRVTEKLGDAELCELTGTDDERAKPLVKIRVAKGKLLGAKVGVIEHRRRAGNARGTNVQNKMNTLRLLKNNQLRQKHATYIRLAKRYNEDFTPNPLLHTPTLQEVEEMDLCHPFLNFGSLIHSTEPWAVDKATQEGMEAYINVCRCTEELRRIAKEARQMLNWAVLYQAKIDHLRLNNSNDIIPTWANKDVMLAITSNLSREAWRLWLSWNGKIISLLHESEPYNVCETGSDDELQDQWRTMVKKCLAEWEMMVHVPTIVAEEDEIGDDDGDDEIVEHDEDEFDYLVYVD